MPLQEVPWALDAYNSTEAHSVSGKYVQRGNGESIAQDSEAIKRSKSGFSECVTKRRDGED